MRRIKCAVRGASAAVVAFSSLLGLALVPVATAATYTCTWTGTAGDDKFSTAGNWSGCNNAAPQAADTNNFVFNNTALTGSTTLDNDITGLQAASIVFSGTGTESYLITGDAIAVSSTIAESTTVGSELATDLVLAGNPTINVASSFLSLSGVISGTGNISKTGAGGLSLEGSNTFTGSLTVVAGPLFQDDTTAFGPSTNDVIINDGADITIGCGVTDLANNLTLNGASSNPTGQLPSPKLLVNSVCGGSANIDEEYGGTTTDGSFSLTGNITLTSDVTFGSYVKTTTLTGNLSGGNKFTLPGNWGGELVLASATNTSGMNNGTYKADVITRTLSDDQSANTVQIDGNAILTIDGKRGDTTVKAGGVLKGTGTVGDLSVDSGAMLEPGHSPGCMSTGNLTLNGTYQAEIGGADACTGYDQLKVSGAVDVSGATLDVERYNDFKDFAAGQSFTIIDNDDSDAVTGSFNGLDEGATMQLDTGTVLGITYKGGDGNDVVLSVKNVPTTPDTGFAAITAHPAMLLAITSLTAGGIASIAYKNRKLAVRR